MATNTIAPALSVGIPAGVDPENVRSRKAAMMAAGTPEIIAESLATTAAHQQHLRDTKKKETQVVDEAPVKAAVVKTVVEKVKVPASKPPKKIAVPIAPAVIAPAASV